MPENYAPYPESNSGKDRVHPAPLPPTSPWNYTIDEEEERAKAMDRANDKIRNAPMRPIL